MRELKFRAWDIKNNKMVYDALTLAETKQLVTVNEEHFNSPFSFFDGCKWMQFTGCKDSDEIDIYEGIYLNIISTLCMMIMKNSMIYLLENLVSLHSKMDVLSLNIITVQ